MGWHPLSSKKVMNGQWMHVCPENFIHLCRWQCGRVLNTRSLAREIFWAVNDDCFKSLEEKGITGEQVGMKKPGWIQKLRLVDFSMPWSILTPQLFEERTAPSCEKPNAMYPNRLDSSTSCSLSLLCHYFLWRFNVFPDHALTDTHSL